MRFWGLVSLGFSAYYMSLLLTGQGGLVTALFGLFNLWIAFRCFNLARLQKEAKVTK